MLRGTNVREVAGVDHVISWTSKLMLFSTWTIGTFLLAKNTFRLTLLNVDTVACRLIGELVGMRVDDVVDEFYRKCVHISKRRFILPSLY